MASFSNDPNHYAHPLFQHMSVPTKKKAIKSKNLPSWMVHTVKRGYTSYLVHTNPNKLTPFEPAGLKYKELEQAKDGPDKDNNIIEQIETELNKTETWLLDKEEEKKTVDKLWNELKDWLKVELNVLNKLAAYSDEQEKTQTEFKTKLKDLGTAIASCARGELLPGKLYNLLGMESNNQKLNEKVNEGFNLYNLVTKRKDELTGIIEMMNDQSDSDKNDEPPAPQDTEENKPPKPPTPTKKEPEKEPEKETEEQKIAKEINTIYNAIQSYRFTTTFATNVKKRGKNRFDAGVAINMVQKFLGKTSISDPQAAVKLELIEDNKNDIDKLKKIKEALGDVMQSVCDSPSQAHGHRLCQKEAEGKKKKKKKKEK